MEPVPSFYFLPATEEDALSVGLRLCAEDELEARLMSGKSAVESILDSYHLTKQMGGTCMTCIINGSPEMIYGIRRDAFLSSDGAVWMLHTDAPARWGLMFAKYSREALRDIVNRSGCDTVGNYVLQDNRRAVRWLQYLGFTFDYHIIMEGRKWLHFFMTKGAGHGCSGRA